MGTYCTTTTLDLTMIGVDFSATNTTTLASKMIDRAEAEINKYLSKRYDISASTFQTTTSVPPLVRSLAEQLSEGYMWPALSRGGAGDKSVERGNELRDGVLENLRLIADYKLDLLDTAGSVITDMSQAGMRVLCNTNDYVSTFNEDDELSWAQDSTKLTDISNGRS